MSSALCAIYIKVCVQRQKIAVRLLEQKKKI